MTNVLLANNYNTVTTAAINNVTTTLPVASVTGLPVIGAGATCYLTIQSGADIEIVLASSVSTLNITVTRGQQGTSALSFPIGSIVSLRWTRDNADPTNLISGKTIATATVANDDKVLTQDTSDSNNLKTVTTQSIRDLSPSAGSITMSQMMSGISDETPTPTANQFPIWDTNTNLSANSFLAGYASTVTAAGTTTLTVASAQTQIFTGVTTQTVTMPVVSTLALGTLYRITNLSSGVVTVQSSGANAIQTMQPNSTLILISNATSGTSATVWYKVEYTTAASDQTGSGSLVRATSPTLVTPTLGVASATSINFGQDTFNYYDEGQWIPSFDAATTGDLALSSVTASGYYTRTGRKVDLHFRLIVTPTYTTASGAIRITGLPFPVSSDLNNNQSVGVLIHGSSFTYTAGKTYVNVNPIAGQTYMQIVATGNGSTVTTQTLATSVASGVSQTLIGTVSYYV